MTSINKSVGRVSEGVHTITSVDMDKFARVGSVRSESASGTETVLTVMPVTTPQGSVWRTKLTVMRDTTTAREDMFVSTVRKILYFCFIRLLMYLIVHDAVLTYFTIRHFRNEKSRLVPECIPQLLLGLLLRIHRSAIGQFFSCP